jgi:hypothetical protein
MRIMYVCRYWCCAVNVDYTPVWWFSLTIRTTTTTVPFV